jgi:hypothetical protein
MLDMFDEKNSRIENQEIILNIHATVINADDFHRRLYKGLQNCKAQNRLFVTRKLQLPHTVKLKPTWSALYTPTTEVTDLIIKCVC